MPMQLLRGEQELGTNQYTGTDVASIATAFVGPEVVLPVRTEQIFGYNQLGPNSIIFDWLTASPASARLSECMPKAGRDLSGRAEVRDMSGYTAAHRHYGRPFDDRTYWDAGPMRQIITVSEHLTRCIRDNLKPILCPSPVVPREHISTDGNSTCALTTGSSPHSVDANYEYRTFGWYMIMGLPWVNWMADFVFRSVCSARIPIGPGYVNYRSGIRETELRALVRQRVENALVLAKALPAFEGDEAGAATFIDTWVINNEMAKSAAQETGFYNFTVLDEVYQTFVDDGLGVTPQFHVYESDTNELSDMAFYEDVTSWMQTYADSGYGLDACPWEIAAIKTHWYEHYWGMHNAANMAARDITLRNLLDYYGRSGPPTDGVPNRDHMNYFSLIAERWAWRTGYSLFANSTIGIGEYAICTGNASREGSSLYTTGHSVQSWAGAWHTIDTLLTTLDLGASHIHTMSHIGNSPDHSRVQLDGSALTTTGRVMKFVAEHYGPLPLTFAEPGYHGGVGSISDPRVGVHAATDDDRNWLWIIVINRNESYGVWHHMVVYLGPTEVYSADTGATSYKYTLALPEGTPWGDTDPDTAIETAAEFTPSILPVFPVFNQFLANRAMVIYKIKLKLS